MGGECLLFCCFVVRVFFGFRRCLIFIFFYLVVWVLLVWAFCFLWYMFVYWVPGVFVLFLLFVIVGCFRLFCFCKILGFGLVGLVL